MGRTKSSGDANLKYNYKVYKPIGYYTSILQEIETGLYIFLRPSGKIKNVYCMEIPNNYGDTERARALNRLKKWITNHPEFEI